MRQWIITDIWNLVINMVLFQYRMVKNLTLNMPVTSTVTGAKGVKADCVTDGVSLESSAFFQKEFQYSNRYSIYTDCRYAEKCPHLRD